MAMSACTVFRRKPPPHLQLIVFFAHPPPNQTRSLHGPPRPNEHTRVAKYPPISPYKTEKEAGVGRAKKTMANLDTVEEKQFQLNRPKYYGWYSYHLKQNWVPYDASKFVQFATQTRVLDGLPSVYSEQEDTVDRLVEKVAPLVEQVVLNDKLYSERGKEVGNDLVPKRDHHAVYWEGGKSWVLDGIREEQLVTKVHQVVSGVLASEGEGEHLRQCSEDFQARNEAFWFRGGIGPDKSMIKKREGVRNWQKAAREKGYKIEGSEDGMVPIDSDDVVMAPYERALQYEGANTVQVRCKEPLPPFVSRSDPLVTEPGQVPLETHDPRNWGYRTSCQHGTNIPGYWPQDDNQHGLLLYGIRNNRYNVQTTCSPGFLDPVVERDQLRARAILSCFGWLLPQAVHLGFGPMTEITYPLATQAVLSDGRCWTYYAYQLNTTDLTSNTPEEQSHNNLLWAGKDKLLYDRVEGGKLVGYDPSVLAPLVKMLLRRPERRSHSLTPYLGEVGLVTDHHDPYQRQFLFDQVRHISSKRPRHYEKPEMYMWEKMQMVDHEGGYSKMLGLRRRRWFQMYKVSHLGREHWHPEFKTLDECKHRYIPKWYREPWQRKKGLGRRYNKLAPKLKVPLQEKVTTYTLPKTTRYQRPEEDW